MLAEKLKNFHLEKLFLNLRLSISPSPPSDTSMISVWQSGEYSFIAEAIISPVSFEENVPLNLSEAISIFLYCIFFVYFAYFYAENRDVIGLFAVALPVFVNLVQNLLLCFEVF